MLLLLLVGAETAAAATGQQTWMTTHLRAMNPDYRDMNPGYRGIPVEYRDLNTDHSGKHVDYRSR